MTQGGLALVLVAALLALVPVVPALAATPPAHVRAELRVNQQGWLPRGAWQTDEPALDMTAAAILAGAAQLSLGPQHREAK